MSPISLDLRLGALIVLCLLAPCLARAQTGWPQAKSDLAADPAARFGVLPNGMRYAVMRNATPAGQTSLRLRIGSGSLEESDAQQGLAHVLEHMSFKGSTHVPAGEEVKILERKGLAFGPDTNASTGWTQTVYMLDLPQSDADTIDTGLMLMRETAGELTLDARALEPERGVVLSEERLRDTPSYRAQKAQLDLLAHGQRITERFPIGLVDVVEHAPTTVLREFYEANYRPERATLVAVGDFDPAAMEAQIRARFSTWRDVGPPIAEPDLGIVERRGLTVKVVELPGASTQSSIAWVRPYDASPDTTAKRRRDTIEGLALAVLNRRFERIAQGSHPPFLQAQAAFENLLHSDKVAIVQAVSPPSEWKSALQGADAEVRRLVAYGVGQDELDREITETRVALVAAAAGAATRRTPDLASAMVQTVDEDSVFTDPAEDLALFDADVKGLTAAQANAAVRQVFSGAGPLVEIATPQPIPGGESAVLAAFRKSEAAPSAAPVIHAAVGWPYADFGPAGTVISRQNVPDLGATQVRFANGVALTVKPTAFRVDQVLVRVDLGAGRRDLPRDRPSPEWAAGAFVSGGLSRISFEDMQRALAAELYGAEFSIEDDAFVLGGQTRTKDLATQLQVLAAYVADPAYRPEAFERLRAALLAALPQMAATPGGVLGRDIAGLLHDGDPRWAFPNRAQLEAATASDLRSMVARPLARGPLEVTIVGDITVDQAIALCAATFGALPPRREQARSASSGQVRFPQPTPLPLHRGDTGRADQAMALMAWPGTDFYADMAGSRAAYLAGDVLQNRILDKVRVAEGATYSPQTAVDFSQVFPRYGFAFSAVETPPAKIAPFFADVDAIAADLGAHAIAPDELERARNPRLANIRKAQLTNEYWLQRLAGSVADPRRLDLIRTTIPDYEKLTAADVQAAAARLFVPSRAWWLVIENDERSVSSPP